MSSITFCLVALLFSLHAVEADTLINPNFPALQPQDDTAYQPSLGVVVGILGIMFVITVVILIYAKLCHDPAARPAVRSRAVLGSGPSRRFSGIDKTVIESLPFFRFSSLKGSKEGLECAVCLSRFDDVEVLRLLPKCKHAFHVDCIDHWLEKHSSCPLCRHRITSDDLNLVTYSSNSMRFLRNNDDDDASSNGLFVQREESFRKSVCETETETERDGFLMEKESGEAGRRVFLHKHNHKIVLSGFAFNNRWSDLRSSDLLTLSSEMLNDWSSGRFAETGDKKEAETKKSLENDEVGVTINNSVSDSRSLVNTGEQRSVSEIASFSRYADSDVKVGIAGSSSLSEGNVKEERVRKMWLPIASRTIHWFVNKDKSELSQSTQTQTTHV